MKTKGLHGIMKIYLRMGILTFVFNKVGRAGYTEDELLQPMREHAQEYNIDEAEQDVFSKDGKQKSISR